jgi:LAS superfamily LD-carboxypeptidase LdcB
MLKKITLILFSWFIIFSMIKLFHSPNINNDQLEKIDEDLQNLSEENQSLKNIVPPFPPKKKSGKKKNKIKKVIVSPQQKEETKKLKLSRKRVRLNSNTPLTDEDMENLEFINEINPNWKDTFTQKMLDSLEENPSLTVKKERSFIKIIGKKAQYVEQVRVIIQYENGKENSFRSIIDSENGKIIRSWDKTIHENFVSRPKGFSPSGSL